MPEPLIVAIAEYAERHGISSIKDLPGCWERQVDGHWWFAMNGHREPMMCSKGTEVPPFSAYVEFNGWPAGVFDFHGGVFAAGAAANEDTFRGALSDA